MTMGLKTRRGTGERGTTMPSRRRFSGHTFRMPDGSSKEGRVRVSTGPYVQIICSVPLIVPGRPGSTNELKEMKRLENCCDLAPGNPRPMVRKPGQRLVAIDPGRRDINYVKTDEAHETPSTCTSSTSKFFWLSQFFGISTRQHVKEVKRRRIATVTIELQKRTLLSAEVFLGGWTYKPSYIWPWSIYRRIKLSKHMQTMKQ